MYRQQCGSSCADSLCSISILNKITQYLISFVNTGAPAVIVLPVASVADPEFRANKTNPVIGNSATCAVQLNISVECRRTT